MKHRRDGGEHLWEVGGGGGGGVAAPAAPVHLLDKHADGRRVRRWVVAVPGVWLRRVSR